MRRDGIVVRASDLQPRGRRFESRTHGRSTSRNNSGQVVHTRVPLFTKQVKDVEKLRRRIVYEWEHLDQHIIDTAIRQ